MYFSIEVRIFFIFLITGIHVLTSKAHDDGTLYANLKDRGLLDLEYTHLQHDSDLLRDRSKREASSAHLVNAIQLEFEYAKESYRLELTSPEEILHPSAEILTFTNGSSLQWTGAHPDCFLTGSVTSHNGMATLSICDNVMGIVRTGKFTLYMESVRESSTNHIPVVVGRHREDIIPTSLTEQNDHNYGRSRRSVTSHNITIELAVYTDAAYTRSMLVTDFSQRLQHILLKYHAVQMEWSRAEMLGFNVRIVLKRVQFFETNPIWYNSSTNLLGNALSEFCLGTVNDGPYDARYLHVGLTNLDVRGRAYQNSVCDQRYSCAVDSSTDAASFAATAHELGHLMGMYHDADRGCTGSDIGLMGGYGTGWSTCSKTDMTNLLNSGNKHCLWEENIPLDDVPRDILNQRLIPEIPGQMYSPDEVCELKYGAGYRFRKYPKLGVCVLFSCANHNYLQVNYGQMFKQYTSIFGMHCGTNKICFKLECVAAATAKLDSLVERQGGWSQWGPWTGCTRTCGRGINSRSRKCDNPPPINTEGCPEDGYEAETCNAEPCPGDSSDQTILWNQRAGETCKRLRDHDVISPELYNETGSRYSDTADGQCEVTCEPVSGYTIPTFTRFGFMPDGVSCIGGSNTWDLNNWPRNSGSYYMCLDGFCQRFGCDNRMNGKYLDECGVCGGDNSSCVVISRTDTKQQNQGERRTLARIPAGSYNIQFWFTYGDMRQNFIEVYDKHGDVILASRIPSSWQWDTRSNPIIFAGTKWYYFFYYQFLHVKGPLTEPCEIKLYQHDIYSNTGVYYSYSESNAVTLECGFESDFCGWSLTRFFRMEYGSNETAIPVPEIYFGEYFIHSTSQTDDVSATITKHGILGSSNDQYLTFNYYVTGMGSNITVSWNEDVIWALNNSQLNLWGFATLTISSLEIYQIKITCTTKVQDSGEISLDNLKLSSDPKPYCDQKNGCDGQTTDLPIVTSQSATDATRGEIEDSSSTGTSSTTPIQSTKTPIPSTTPIQSTKTPIPSTTPIQSTKTPIPSTTPIQSITPIKTTATPMPLTTPSQSTTFIPSTTSSIQSTSSIPSTTSSIQSTTPSIPSTTSSSQSTSSTIQSTTSSIQSTSSPILSTSSPIQSLDTSTHGAPTKDSSSPLVSTAKTTPLAELSTSGAPSTDKTQDKTDVSSETTTPMSTVDITPVWSSTITDMTTVITTDAAFEWKFVGAVTGIAVGLCVIILVVVIVACYCNCSWCKAKAKHRDIYRVSGLFDGASKPLSTGSNIDTSDIKIYFHTDNNSRIETKA
ncbi:A disintegrin and metalloproteinase with thrombospondin motifs 7-like isoform X2 [Ostrea edulis]|uniref:A disintegrin and metalloproteinase with thrombospondin motifs 7-like isoform X2 n=1 Tax=Ostrea edulis TaxID=37623 RepID=UPI0024AF43E3|nr:A disintegrin and metalloproteinase with thrombospondin motifs 7-like isoform X2 [Ostrea edulis]